MRVKVNKQQGLSQQCYRRREDDFYDMVQRIYEPEYNSDLPKKVFLFYCQGFYPTRNEGTKVHPQYSIAKI